MSAIKNKILKHLIGLSLSEYKKGKSKSSSISQILKNVNKVNASSETKVKEIWKLITKKKS